jgi:hypothetical protein
LALQKRAAQELFDWFGLDKVPVAYWRILSELGDPVESLTQFIVRLGLDPLKVRRRDPDDIEAFRSNVLVLLQQEKSSQAAAGQVSDGPGLADVIASLDEALRLFKVSSATFRIRSFVLLAARVESLRQSPNAIESKEARTALEQARSLAEATWRHAIAAARYRGALSKLDAGWTHGSPTVEDSSTRQRLIDAALAAERSLLDNAHCNVEQQVSAYSAAVFGLQSLVHRMQERAWKSADQMRVQRIQQERRREKEEVIRRRHRQSETQEDDGTWAATLALIDKEPSQMSLDELLGIFSFMPGSRPTSLQVRKAFMRMAQLLQPRPGEPNFVEKNIRYRRTVYAYKTLRMAMST